jgi:hypothetical protein
VIRGSGGEIEEGWQSVSREEMLAQLTKLREDKLRQEISGLQEKSNCRQIIEQTLANATVGAQDTIGLNLRDLGMFGEVRLGCFRLSQELSRQILHRSNQVMRAKKLAESTRAAHREIVAERLATEETLRERDAEQFLAWRRNRRG